MPSSRLRFALREFRPSDASAVNRVALAGFAEYDGAWEGSAAARERNARAAEIAAVGTLILACLASDERGSGESEEVVGIVAYLGVRPPGASANAPPEWPVVRMLAVDPTYRGHGIGRALTEECVRRARAEGAPAIALHTSPLMRVALPMYERLGFELHYAVPPERGEPSLFYVKSLTPTGESSE